VGDELTLTGSAAASGGTVHAVWRRAKRGWEPNAEVRIQKLEFRRFVFQALKPPPEYHSPLCFLSEDFSVAI